MRILAIETSCDETAVAVVDDGVHVRSNIISSSLKNFEKTGGVIPEEAARKQIECMLPVLHEALQPEGSDFIDAIAVTKGPGLLGSLLVGNITARTLSRLWKKPLVGIHHTLGHLSSTWLDTTPDDQPAFPILTLSASGGHTELWLRKSHTRGRLLGRTRDDAAGEAFDKGASLLGLPYPGGPAIAESALKGKVDAFDFPLPLKKDDTFDFSFSGLKTALRYILRDTPDWESKLPDLASSFQEAICDHLVDRLSAVLDAHPDIREIHVVGGVSANKRLRELVTEKAEGRTVRFPKKLSYCTDNAAMIAAAAEFVIQEKGQTAYEDFETKASLPLEEAVTG